MPHTTLLRVSGSHRVHTGHDHAHLFAQPRTRRISQFYGLNFSTGSSISPLLADASLPNYALIFIGFREFASAATRPGRPLPL